MEDREFFINIISICVNSFLSLCAISVSIFVFQKTKSDNKANLESAILENIQNTKTALDNAMFEWSKLKKKDRNELKVDSLIESYLTCLNYGCFFAKCKKIDIKRFKAMFYFDVKNSCEKEVFWDIIKPNPQAYSSLVEAYSEWNKCATSE